MRVYVCVSGATSYGNNTNYTTYGANDVDVALFGGNNNSQARAQFEALVPVRIVCASVCEKGVCVRVCAAQSFCLSVILMPLFRSALRQVTFLFPFSFRLLDFLFFFSQQAFYSFTFLISGDAAWVS